MVFQTEVDKPVESTCKLLGGFGLLIQAGMGTLVLICLYFKREMEKPKRKWIPFILDISKQIFSGALQHSVNTLFSVIAGTFTDSDQCGWYLTSLIMDFAIGLPSLWYLMLMMDEILSKKHSVFDFKSETHYRELLQHS